VFSGATVWQRGNAIGNAVAQVKHVHELVDHHVVAPLCGDTRLGNVVPRQHHRPAVHGLARQLFVVVVDHADLVHVLASGPNRIGMDDDAFEAVVPRQAQVQNRQAGLRCDGNGHFIADVQALHAGELFVGQEKRAQFAQAPQVAV
jgi:hypothetical protein